MRCRRSPGVFVLEDESGRALHVGRAAESQASRRGVTSGSTGSAPAPTTSRTACVRSAPRLPTVHSTRGSWRSGGARRLRCRRRARATVCSRYASTPRRMWSRDRCCWRTMQPTMSSRSSVYSRLSARRAMRSRRSRCDEAFARHCSGCRSHAVSHVWRGWQRWVTLLPLRSVWLVSLRPPRPVRPLRLPPLRPVRRFPP